MKAYRLLALGAAAALALGLAACGSSSSSSSTPPPVNLDPDGDGIPTVDDFFPTVTERFAAFESFTDPAQATAFSVAVGVSDASESAAVAVGQSDLGGAVLRAQRWSLDTSVNIPGLTTETLPPLGTGTYSAAYGVNASGLAVGESGAGTPLTTVPVYWAPAVAPDPAAATALPLTLTISTPNPDPTLPPTVVETILYNAGSAYGVNDAGQIVGEVRRISDGSMRAVLWQPGAEGYGEAVELSGDTGAAAAPYYINAAGWVVGQFTTLDGPRAALWTVTAAGVVDSGPTNLGVPSGHVASSAWGVDSLGRIVGESEASNGATTALLWEAFDDPAGPKSLGANASAAAISDNNRIAGSATTAGEMQAAVWDTRSTVPPPPTNFDAVISSGVPNFTPLEGESRGYAMSASGVIAGIDGDTAFVAIPQAPQ